MLKKSMVFIFSDHKTNPAYLLPPYLSHSYALIAYAVDRVVSDLNTLMKDTATELVTGLP